MQIFPLSEGSFTIDRTKQFVPFDEEKDILNDRPTGSLLVEIQPFLVVTSKDVLLLDCGLGFSIGDELQLHRNLKAAGYHPQQVTKVLMSHLHKDHAGGVAFGPGNNWLSLPNATYYVRQKELEFARAKDNPSYIQDDLEALHNSAQVELLTDDEGSIDGYIRYRHTGAHSPEHQVFWISEGGDTIFFGGDDAPQLQQMKIRYKTKYDFNPERATQLRQQWWEEGNREGWTFLFYHDIKTPTYKSKNADPV
ncbi:MBL fold metallo-hydrolase [Flaviaesturariibacter aridisoli]|uniref:MBL fold metallo-hydrolase n=1 Tax=Flaviaesturariibacter aridisoli TaxID=2545761 RepID=A0A4R4E061_9BACT|nr:MBL fold metallo-hydrolase [Flaviaesturariibacter aridisoli]TCZ67212.1 MBL fold metallo-hydrolase [Flaviaesturariibacter aridisoli]